MEPVSDTRQKLIDAAQQLIYASSYTDVGVQQICEEAGVKKGSFYHFFPSKRDLTLAALDQFQDYYRDHILAEAFSRKIPPLKRFEKFFELAYEFQKQVKDNTGMVQGCPFGNLGCEMSTQDEAIRNKINTIFNNVEKPFQQALDDAVASGELASIDTAATARALFAYTEGIMMYAKTRNDLEIIREMGQRALQLAIPGMPTAG